MPSNPPQRDPPIRIPGGANRPAVAVSPQPAKKPTPTQQPTQPRATPPPTQPHPTPPPPRATPSQPTPPPPTAPVGGQPIEKAPITQPPAPSPAPTQPQPSPTPVGTAPIERAPTPPVERIPIGGAPATPPVTARPTPTPTPVSPTPPRVEVPIGHVPTPRGGVSGTPIHAPPPGAAAGAPSPTRTTPTPTPTAPAQPPSPAPATAPPRGGAAQPLVRVPGGVNRPAIAAAAGAPTLASPAYAAAAAAAGAGAAGAQAQPVMARATVLVPTGRYARQMALVETERARLGLLAPGGGGAIAPPAAAVPLPQSALNTLSRVDPHAAARSAVTHAAGNVVNTVRSMLAGQARPTPTVVELHLIIPEGKGAVVTDAEFHVSAPPRTSAEALRGLGAPVAAFTGRSTPTTVATAPRSRAVENQQLYNAIKSAVERIQGQMGWNSIMANEVVNVVYDAAVKYANDPTRLAGAIASVLADYGVPANIAAETAVMIVGDPSNVGETTTVSDVTYTSGNVTVTIPGSVIAEIANRIYRNLLHSVATEVNNVTRTLLDNGAVLDFSRINLNFNELYSIHGELVSQIAAIARFYAELVAQYGGIATQMLRSMMLRAGDPPGIVDPIVSALSSGTKVTTKAQATTQAAAGTGGGAAGAGGGGQVTYTISNTDAAVAYLTSVLEGAYTAKTHRPAPSDVVAGQARALVNQFEAWLRQGGLNYAIQQLANALEGYGLSANVAMQDAQTFAQRFVVQQTQTTTTAATTGGGGGATTGGGAAGGAGGTGQGQGTITIVVGYTVDTNGALNYIADALEKYVFHNSVSPSSILSSYGWMFEMDITRYGPIGDEKDFVAAIARNLENLGVPANVATSIAEYVWQHYVTPQTVTVPAPQQGGFTAPTIPTGSTTVTNPNSQPPPPGSPQYQQYEYLYNQFIQMGYSPQVAQQLALDALGIGQSTVPTPTTYSGKYTVDPTAPPSQYTSIIDQWLAEDYAKASQNPNAYTGDPRLARFIEQVYEVDPALGIALLAYTLEKIGAYASSNPTMAAAITSALTKGLPLNLISNTPSVAASTLLNVSQGKGSVTDLGYLLWASDTIADAQTKYNVLTYAGAGGQGYNIAETLKKFSSGLGKAADQAYYMGVVNYLIGQIDSATDPNTKLLYTAMLISLLNDPNAPIDSTTKQSLLGNATQLYESVYYSTYVAPYVNQFNQQVTALGCGKNVEACQGIDPTPLKQAIQNLDTLYGITDDPQLKDAVSKLKDAASNAQTLKDVGTAIALISMTNDAASSNNPNAATMAQITANYISNLKSSDPKAYDIINTLLKNSMGVSVDQYPTFVSLYVKTNSDVSKAQSDYDTYVTLATSTNTPYGTAPTVPVGTPQYEAYTLLTQELVEQGVSPQLASIIAALSINGMDPGLVTYRKKLEDDIKTLKADADAWRALGFNDVAKSLDNTANNLQSALNIATATYYANIGNYAAWLGSQYVQQYNSSSTPDPSMLSNAATAYSIAANYWSAASTLLAPYDYNASLALSDKANKALSYSQQLQALSTQLQQQYNAQLDEYTYFVSLSTMVSPGVQYIKDVFDGKVRLGLDKQGYDNTQKALKTLDGLYQTAQQNMGTVYTYAYNGLYNWAQDAHSNGTLSDSGYSTVMTYLQDAQNAWSQGNYSQAYNYLQQAYNILSSAGTPPDPNTATALGMLGLFVNITGNYNTYRNAIENCALGICPSIDMPADAKTVLKADNLWVPVSLTTGKIGPKVYAYDYYGPVGPTTLTYTGPTSWLKWYLTDWLSSALGLPKSEASQVASVWLWSYNLSNYTWTVPFTNVKLPVGKAAFDAFSFFLGTGYFLVSTVFSLGYLGAIGLTPLVMAASPFLGVTPDYAAAQWLKTTKGLMYNNPIMSPLTKFLLGTELASTYNPRVWTNTPITVNVNGKTETAYLTMPGFTGSAIKVTKNNPAYGILSFMSQWLGVPVLTDPNGNIIVTPDTFGALLGFTVLVAAPMADLAGQGLTALADALKNPAPLIAKLRAYDAPDWVISLVERMGQSGRLSDFGARVFGALGSAFSAVGELDPTSDLVDLVLDHPRVLAFFDRLGKVFHIDTTDWLTRTARNILNNASAEPNPRLIFWKSAMGMIFGALAGTSIGYTISLAATRDSPYALPSVTLGTFGGMLAGALAGWMLAPIAMDSLVRFVYGEDSDIYRAWVVSDRTGNGFWFQAAVATDAFMKIPYAVASRLGITAALSSMQYADPTTWSSVLNTSTEAIDLDTLDTILGDAKLSQRLSSYSRLYGYLKSGDLTDFQQALRSYITTYAPDLAEDPVISKVLSTSVDSLTRMDAEEAFVRAGGFIKNDLITKALSTRDASINQAILADAVYSYLLTSKTPVNNVALAVLALTNYDRMAALLNDMGLDVDADALAYAFESPPIQITLNVVDASGKVDKVTVETSPIGYMFLRNILGTVDANGDVVVTNPIAKAVIELRSIGLPRITPDDPAEPVKSWFDYMTFELNKYLGVNINIPKDTLDDLMDALRQLKQYMFPEAWREYAAVVNYLRNPQGFADILRDVPLRQVSDDYFMTEGTVQLLLDRVASDFKTIADAVADQIVTGYKTDPMLARVFATSTDFLIGDVGDYIIITAKSLISTAKQVAFGNAVADFLTATIGDAKNIGVGTASRALYDMVNRFFPQYTDDVADLAKNGDDPSVLLATLQRLSLKKDPMLNEALDIYRDIVLSRLSDPKWIEVASKPMWIGKYAEFASKVWKTLDKYGLTGDPRVTNNIAYMQWVGYSSTSPAMAALEEEVVDEYLEEALKAARSVAKSDEDYAKAFDEIVKLYKEQFGHDPPRAIMRLGPAPETAVAPPPVAAAGAGGGELTAAAAPEVTEVTGAVAPETAAAPRIRLPEQITPEDIINLARRWLETRDESILNTLKEIAPPDFVEWLIKNADRLRNLTPEEFGREFESRWLQFFGSTMIPPTKLPTIRPPTPGEISPTLVPETKPITLPRTGVGEIPQQPPPTPPTPPFRIPRVEEIPRQPIPIPPGPGPAEVPITTTLTTPLPPLTITVTVPTTTTGTYVTGTGTGGGTTTTTTETGAAPTPPPPPPPTGFIMPFNEAEAQVIQQSGRGRQKREVILV